VGTRSGDRPGGAVSLAVLADTLQRVVPLLRPALAALPADVPAADLDGFAALLRELAAELEAVAAAAVGRDVGG